MYCGCVPAPDDDFLARAGDLAMYAARLVRATRRDAGVSPDAGLRVLSILDEFGPLGVTQLAQIDGCAQPSMSGTVNGLAERGWVIKERHPDDARAALVVPTGAGRAALAAARRRNAEAVAAWLAAAGHQSPEELDVAVGVLRDALHHSYPKGAQ